MRAGVVLGTIAFAAALAAGAGRAWALAVLPSGTELALEIAADEPSRIRGYMGRAAVGRNEGMLFVFETTGRHGIWMKNCLVALDVLWLDEERRIVEIARGLEPCPAEGPCPTALPMRAARYVLEVAAGTADRERLALGDRIELLDVATPGGRS